MFLNRRMPNWSLNLTVMSGNIRTLPSRFRTMRWWPCWLKETKNSTDGVKKGQNGRLKKDSRLST